MNPALLELLGARAAAGGGYVFRDTFSRPDGDLYGTTADTGQVWSGMAGRVAISGGKARITLDLDNYATVDCGVSDLTMTADLTFGGDTASLALRTPATTTFENCFCVSFTAGGVTLLSKAAAGPMAELASTTATVSNGSHAVEITALGSLITVKLDGATVLTHTTAAHQTQTGVGIYSWGRAPANYWDNLTVTAL